MIFVNNLDPILFSIGPVSVRWYGALFALGILLNYFILVWIFKREKYRLEHLDSLALYLFFGLVIGARLGHILFYNASYFLSNPLEILMVWKGGLASHGAAIGITIAYLLWCKLHKVKFSKYVNALVVPMPLTAVFVRMGNFFNSEIIGTPTDGDYGVVFQRLGEDFPRHPAQLYEGLMSLVVFVILLVVYKKFYSKIPPLFLMFLYILLYFGGRVITEIWKARHVVPESFPLSMGQILSLVALVLSIGYFVFVYPRQRKKT